MESPPLPVMARPSSNSSTSTPHAVSASAIVAIRSDSLTRSSCAPRATVRPAAIAAATNSTGYSSIMLGVSSGGTSMALSGAWRTRRSATGSPPTIRGSCSVMSAPIAISAANKPVRVGFMPTLAMMMSDPGTIDAATAQNAADEGSPGTTMSCARSSASPLSEMMRPSGVSSTVRSAPKPLSIRSEWSRVATGSITRVIPGVLSPASRTADLTCAEATGSV